MSPKQKTIATSARTDSRASSGSGSTVSTLPAYVPPPSYSYSSTGGKSPIYPYHPSPYTNVQSPTAAPVMKLVDLPNVSDPTPPALLQAIADILLDPISLSFYIDFADPTEGSGSSGSGAPWPRLEHLGPASHPIQTSFPLQFDLSSSSESDNIIIEAQREKGIRIHDIIASIHRFLHEPILSTGSLDSDSEPSTPSRKRISLLGDRTVFGGLKPITITTAHKTQYIWLVRFVSRLSFPNSPPPNSQQQQQQQQQQLLPAGSSPSPSSNPSSTTP